MTRTTAVLAAAMMVVGMVGAVPTAGAAVPGSADDANAVGSDVVYAQGNGTETNGTNANETETDETDDGTDGNDTVDGNDAANRSVAPGERLSGVVGVQGAEIEGEVESRTFGVQVARAATNDTKGRIVAEKLNDTDTTLQEYEEQLEELEEEYEAGNLTHGQYVSKVAVLETRMKNTRRQLDQTEDVSEGLPEHVREANGVNATAIRALKQQADNATGPEVAAAARTIAGPEAGTPMAGGPPGKATAPGQAKDAAPGRSAGTGPGGGNDSIPGQSSADVTTTTAPGERSDPDERPGGPNADERRNGGPNAGIQRGGPLGDG